MPNPTPVTPAREPIIDPATGFVSRPWYMFFTSLLANSGGGTGSGTVTNVATGTGLTGGPITTTGTIQLATAYGDARNPYGSKTANYVLAAPNGAAGVPTFRALVAADVPTLNQNTTGNAATATNIAGGVAYEIPYQSAASTTAFIPAPTTASTYLSWNGSAFTWGTVSATVNWAVPGALGSTTPNDVYVSSGNANAIAFFDPAVAKKIISDLKFRADPDGNGTLGVYASTTNNYSIGSSYGYIAGGSGSTLSCFFGTPNNGADTCVVSYNAYWDPSSGFAGEYIYDKTGAAAMWAITSGGHAFRTASSGTGGTAITWNTPLQLVGNLVYAETFATKIVSQSTSAGVGYATGAGSSVTQLTSKSTAVTLNNICGKIQMAANSLAGNTNVSFTLNNSTIAATDVVIVNASNVGGSSPTANTYMVAVDSVLAGSCRILVRNVSAVSASQALILNFAVIKAVQA